MVFLVNMTSCSSCSHETRPSDLQDSKVSLFKEWISPKHMNKQSPHLTLLCHVLSIYINLRNFSKLPNKASVRENTTSRGHYISAANNPRNRSTKVQKNHKIFEQGKVVDGNFGEIVWLNVWIKWNEHVDGSEISVIVEDRLVIRFW